MFDKKDIMKNAWMAAGNAVHFHGGKKSEYFAICLKEEWSRAKVMNGTAKKNKMPAKKNAFRTEKTTNEIVAIKDWFIRKNFTQDKAYVISSNDWIEVIEETAKAYRLKVHNADFGDITTWAPKSCCVA